MTDDTTTTTDHGPLDARSEDLDADTLRLAAETATSFAAFLLALRAIAAAGEAGPGVSLLLLETSRVSLAGARLGAQHDFTPHQEYQPDVGPEADVEEMRLRLAAMLGGLDTYSFVFDPYVPEVVESQLSDDLTSIALDLENGLRHYRSGNVAEALWWWQYSYVNSWGNLAGAMLNALISVVSHDRLDVDNDAEADQIEVAEAVLDGGPA